MSLVYHKKGKKKAKYPRNRISRKIIRRRKIRKTILRNRGWKLAYPDHFKLIDDFPYIVRKE